SVRNFNCFNFCLQFVNSICLLSPCLSLRFDDKDHNCFTFCLRFINSVLATEGRRSLSRETFTHSFILPRMRRVTKYTTLYQHIQRHQYYVVDRQGDRKGDSPLN
ncbi:MKRN2 opposite strand protein-like, partial [Epinephelus moara]|uniref:MKRN2 opposite strand protein-like n=1 Tax=Epinephelus moara TaxID=300413 RepID=UPI00214F39F8